MIWRAIKKIGLAYLAVFDTPERIAFTRAIIRDPSGTRRSAASIIRTASAMWPAV